MQLLFIDDEVTMLQHLAEGQAWRKNCAKHRWPAACRQLLAINFCELHKELYDEDTELDQQHMVQELDLGPAPDRDYRLNGNKVTAACRQGDDEAQAPDKGNRLMGC